MHAVLKELRPTLALALPMIVGQVSQMLIGITDSAFIGRIGTVPLAAAAFTHSVWVIFYIVGIGLLLGVGVFTARDHGAGDHARCTGWLRHGRALALAVGGVSVVLLLAVSSQLGRFGQPAEVVAIMRPYFVLQSLSLVPVFYFQVQRQYLDAFGRPWVGTSVILIDVGVNALLNWVFIGGHLGAPALGFTGSGVATLTARTLAVMVIAWWLRGERAGAPALERARFRELLALGVPAATALLFEGGAFASAALMMGWLGATPLAAHQVALSCVSFTFMFPLGLAMAASIRVSKALGEGRREALRAIGLGALGLGSGAMLVFALVFARAGGLLARGFTADPTVVALAAQLLGVAAIFQLFDGGQVVCAGALRGLGDVRVPTAITFVAYWLIALPSGYLLAFKAGFGPLGVWSALAAGLGCAALLLGRRFLRLTAGAPVSR